ncbi:SRPBCC family protein [Actinophytocola sp. NPDC049390]|uniref:SRPBCC family protein n=1 Tax=Actinophytocola sp. NPDC049390 TaxID=3363894 RepID=UPI0037BB57C7
MIEPSASARTVVDASPDVVYALVSDPPKMSELTEELDRATWLGGVGEAAVGARFRGHNRRAWRRWSTTATVTDAEPGRRFAFEVSSFAGIPVSRWQYDIVAAGVGCVVEERTWDRRPAWFRPFANLVTGVRDRADQNQRNMEHTLARLKSAVEAARG